MILCCVCSSHLFAEPPPRRLPLPIDVVPAMEQPFGPEVNHFADGNGSAALELDATPRVDLIPTTDALHDRAGAIELTSHSPGVLPNQGGALRIGQLQNGDSARTRRVRPASRGTGLSKVVASLAVVLGLLFGFVWASRRLGTSRKRGLPDEVVQVLGQFPLGGRQQATVVRFGSKLLALSITPGGIETLGELDDHLEVESLTQLCLGSDSGTVPSQVRDAVDRYAAARGM